MQVRRLLIASSLAVSLALSLAHTAFALPSTERVSLSSSGTQANADSLDADVSADGRYVVFSSAATDESQLTGGVLRLAHDGPATRASVTLGATGAGTPGSVELAPLKVGRGQKLELKPRSWSDLGRGVRFTVRSKSGRVVRRGNARLRPSHKVKLGAVKAKRKGKRVVVSGRIAKPGSAPMISAVATVVRRGKTLSRRAAVKRGKKVRRGHFSLPVKLGKVPRGARVEVEVLLIDESPGLATARRHLRAR